MNSNQSDYNVIRQFIPVTILCLAIATVALIPLSVIGRGFLPQDDALRHAAKVVSEKSWGDILVMRSGIPLDIYSGWHSLLGLIHKSVGGGPDGLVVFSVAALAICFMAVPLFFVRRAEAWLATLLIMLIADPVLIMRLFLGRPYIVPMVAIVIIGFVWRDLDDRSFKPAPFVAAAAAIACAVWLHTTWYLFALPLAAFIFSGRRNASLRFAAACAVGVTAGALATGTPLVYLAETLRHVLRDIGSGHLQRFLVTELHPFNGDPLMVGLIAAVFAWRVRNGQSIGAQLREPFFLLAAGMWISGFWIERFWLDWGMPAVAVWIAEGVEAGLGQEEYDFSFRRLGFAIALSTALYLGVSSDYNGRWTRNLRIEYLNEKDAALSGWLPEPGGIIYSNDMTVFFQTFYANPKAPWRYMLGFESTMMPPEDLEILRRIQWNFGAAKGFEPWVKKMKEGDRIVVRGDAAREPGIKGLEWHYAVTGTWIGRLPRRAV